jgi:hypothetical protein
VFAVKYERLVSEVNAVLREYNVALTLRQLFYQLVSKHVFANTESNYKRLSRVLVKAREKEDVGASRIEDRSRQVLGQGDWGYESPESFLSTVERGLRESWKRFSLTLWEDQHYQVLVALEKDALSRLVSAVAGDFRVKTFPTRGYGSYTYVSEIVQECDGDKPTIIVYLGDYDPSGLDIQRDLESRLERYGAEDFKIERVALTLEQIQRYQLPPIPAKTSDPRLARFMADTGGSDVVELDALPPNILQDVLRNAIQHYIDMEKWNTRVKRIRKEKEKLRQKLETLEVKW